MNDPAHPFSQAELDELIAAAEPPLDAPHDVVVEFIRSLQPGERVIELGRSCTFGGTGTVIPDKKLPHHCVRWDQKFGPSNGQMTTSTTGGTRRVPNRLLHRVVKVDGSQAPESQPKKNIPELIQEWAEFTKDIIPTWFSHETKIKLPELLHQFQNEVHVHTTADADEFTDVDMASFTTGWAIAKGLPRAQAQAFSSFVRYKTPLG